MDDAFWSAAQKVGVPIVAMIGAWVTTTVRIKERVSYLQKSFKKLAEDLKKENEDYRQSVRQGLRLELDHLEQLLSERIERLKEDLDEYKRTIEKIRDSSHDYASDAALAHFISENNERWERTLKTLGMLEGILNNPPSRKRL